MLKFFNSKLRNTNCKKKKKKLDQSLEFCVSQQCSNLEFWPKKLCQRIVVQQIQYKNLKINHTNKLY